ncbi:hypothetical protein ABAC460_10445 [Asticcacaulis sp. AC460]|uniref:ThuA domain-containing protein n=1 Tax=Asticcacaulis sp. AC460 TaxID=1282360 RepID=UPI0003C3E7FE|nr:ThuA domain-containing protein [Asticcacaulis sp. AC460]ESQ90161.1 hypothetical protein ABAC460_10445 [Asticcacaulis sp. AC460]
MKRLVLVLVALLAAWVPSVSWADSQFKLMVLAMPSKYHYEYVPIARDSLEKMARLHEFEISWAGAGWALEQDLSGYRAIVLLNTPVEDLTPVQREKFEAYVKAGGHVMVVHRAAIALPAQSWPWYEQLVGRTVGVHPMLQTGVVTVEDKGFPAVFGLSQRWVWSDEFYTTTNPYGVEIHPVLNVDESSYDPEKIWPGQVVKPMGKDHPIAWYHFVGKSRVFVTTLGHNGEAYRDPQYLAHLLGGIYWTATGLGQSE